MWLGAGVLAALSLAAGPPADGVNLTAYQRDGYRLPAATAALDDVRDAGLRRVAVVVTWYVDDLADATVEPDPHRTPSDASVEALVRAARERGMSVLLKPQVDVHDGSFRGDLAPADPALWWWSYEAMIDRYAALAQRAGADALTVGVELRSLSGDGAAFERIIASARERFGGELTYAANWDEALGVGFWPALDVIGVDAYYPLAHAPGATVDALRAAWEPHVAALGRLSERVDRPVLLTELGYAARPDAAVDPAQAGFDDGPLDVEAQRRAYEAARAAWDDVPWLRGILWWDWPVDPRDAQGAAYTPRDRPAEELLGEGPGARSRTAVAAIADAVPWPLVAIVAVWGAVALAILGVVRASDRRRRRRPAGPPPPDGIRPTSPPPPDRIRPTSPPPPDGIRPTSPPPPDGIRPMGPPPPDGIRPTPPAAIPPPPAPAEPAAPATPAPAPSAPPPSIVPAVAGPVAPVSPAPGSAPAIAGTVPPSPASAPEASPPRPRRRFARADGSPAPATPTRDALADLGPPDPRRLVALTRRVLGADACDIRDGDDALAGRRHWPAMAETPLLVAGRMRGTLTVARADAARPFEPGDLELLAAMAELVAATLAAPAGRPPAASVGAQVEALVGARAGRAGDERQRGTLAVALARRLADRLFPDDPRARAELVLATRLHDVGMLRVPRAPLRRPGPLGPTDARLVEAHPGWGSEILAGVPGLAAVAAIVRFHQERPDGRGYPHGLPGDRIPRASLAVGACAAWSAIVAGGPHVAPRTPEHAVAELRRHAGTQFDAAVVEAIATASPLVPVLRVPA